MKYAIVFYLLLFLNISFAQHNVQEIHAIAQRRNQDDAWTSPCKHSTYTSEEVKYILSINEEVITTTLQNYDPVFFDQAAKYLVNDDVIAIIGYYLIKYNNPSSGPYYTVRRFYNPAKNTYFPIFEPYFETYNIPKAFMLMPIAETDLNTEAFSRKGAVGLWQFTSGTAQKYGLIDENGDRRKDTAASTEAAAKYLAHLHNYFGYWPFAALGYNVNDKVLEQAIRASFIMPRTLEEQWETFRTSLVTENFCHLNRIVALSYVFAHYDATR